MQNLNIIRAKHADDRCGDINKAREESGEGDSMSGFPALIINNGLIAALLYSMEGSREQAKAVADAIGYHLGKAPSTKALLPNTKDGKTLLTALIDGDSTTLRVSTEESLLFLAYLKRFVKIDSPSDNS